MLWQNTDSMPPGRTILITGCSSGCGLDAAHTLRARGWRVFASCRKLKDCEELRIQGFDSPRIDYADEASIYSGYQEVMDATGGTLDALYNNGAFALLGAVEDVPTAGLRELFEANFFGWHTLTQLAIKTMRRQGPPSPGSPTGYRGAGRIIQHSSGYGLFAGAFRMAYCASKHALEAHAQCLRQELADTEIHVVLLNTGLIRTQIREKSRAQWTKWIAPLVERSAWRSLYQTKLEVRLFGPYVPDPMEGETPLVTHEVLRALESPTPCARYYVTKLIWALAFLVRVIPSRAMDAFLNKATNGVPVFGGRAARCAVLHPPEKAAARREGGGGGGEAAEGAAPAGAGDSLKRD